MAKYHIRLGASDRIIEAAKAIRSGDKIIFYEADGRGIVAQIPRNTPFMKEEK